MVSEFTIVVEFPILIKYIHQLHYINIYNIIKSWLASKVTFRIHNKIEHPAKNTFILAWECFATQSCYTKCSIFSIYNQFTLNKEELTVYMSNIKQANSKSLRGYVIIFCVITG